VRHGTNPSPSPGIHDRAGVRRRELRPLPRPIADTIQAVTLTARAYVDRFAEALGVPALTDEQVDKLLALAAVAAHASERTAAPLSCWLSASAGVAPEEALATAERLAETLDDRG